MKNVTLSIDDDLLDKGREYARAHRISFNALIRRLLRTAVDRKDERWYDEMFASMDEVKASSKRSWTREELYRV